MTDGILFQSFVFPETTVCRDPSLRSGWSVIETWVLCVNMSETFTPTNKIPASFLSLSIV